MMQQLGEGDARGRDGELSFEAGVRLILLILCYVIGASGWALIQDCESADPTLWYCRS